MAVFIVGIRLALWATVRDTDAFLSIDDGLYAFASGLAAAGLLFAARRSS
jgi:hypothetical protein